MKRLNNRVQDTAHCPRCGDQRLVERKGVNHLLHALLAVGTAGVWLLVWLAIALRAPDRPYRCQVCGLEMLRLEEAGSVTREPLDSGRSPGA